MAPNTLTSRSHRGHEQNPALTTAVQLGPATTGTAGPVPCTGSQRTFEEDAGGKGDNLRHVTSRSSLSQAPSTHLEGRRGYGPARSSGRSHCPSSGKEPARNHGLLWPQLCRAERREEMFELSEQETSIYACSLASRTSSAASLLGDFMTSAEKQSRVSKKKNR